MNTIALDVSVVIGLEVAASAGIAWLCWRLGQRRNLIALRDISRAFVATAAGVLTQTLDVTQAASLSTTVIHFGRSLAVWLYLGFLVLGAAELANNNFVTNRTRRDAALGAILAALLTTGISIIAANDAVTQDMIRVFIRASGIVVASLVIARIISKAQAPPKMVIGASVVRVALAVVGTFGAVRAFVALSRGVGATAGVVQWQPLLLVEFVAHCALGVGLVVWLLDRDYAIADASIMSAEHRAASDALTGLPNRTILMDRLEMAVAAAKRGGTQLGVLYIDLDEFKEVNDRHGHLAGDDVLKEVGSRLQHLLRASDTIGRIGGDEFLAISPYLRNSDDLDVVVSKVREALHHVVVHEGVTINVDGSVGAALFPRDGDTPTALLAVSDSALYRDKGTRTGRRGVVQPSFRTA